MLELVKEIVLGKAEAGGGGSTINNEDMTITENGEYTASEGYTGIGTATVNVPQPAGEINITANSIVDVTNYATANVNVPAGSQQKFGATIDNFLGNVAQDGGLEQTVGNLNIVFSGVTTLNNTALTGKFMCDTGYHIGNAQLVKSVSFPDLKTITGQNALYRTFYNQKLLESVSFPELETISSGQYGFYATFTGCGVLKSLSFPKLKQITGITYSSFSDCCRACPNLESVSFPLLESVNSANSCFQTAFYECPKLTDVDFSSLNLMRGALTFSSAFSRCTSLTTLSFPSLNSQSFGTVTNHFSNMLQGVTGCTVHFPSNLQSVIGSWSDVTNGFGGTNTTVLWDLSPTE